MSKEERAEKVREMEAQIRELFAEEGFARWLKVRRTFRDYSWGNQLMIAMQRPDATRVAGFKAWKKIDRHVRKGEKSIRIWAPMVLKRRDENGEPDKDGDTFLRFRLVPVFDIAQTDGAELPELNIPEIESGMCWEALARLEAFAISRGFAVSYSQNLGGALGTCKIDSREITVLASLSEDAKLKTLAHELAHGLGKVDYVHYTRDRAEVIVETAAAVACGTVGLKCDPYSIPYIAAYAKNEDGLKVLREDLGEIHKLASQLEEAMLAPAEERALVAA